MKGACHALSCDKLSRRIWLAESYFTGLKVHNLTGDEVWIALSSANLISLTGFAREKHPSLQLVIAADRDLNGDGQHKEVQAAAACNGIVALPPVFGD